MIDRLDRRLRVLLKIASVLVVIVLLVEPLYQGMAERQDQRDRLSHQWDKMQRLVQQKDVNQQKLRMVLGNRQYKAYFLAAETPTLASALLQRQLQDLMTQHQASLVSTQVLPSKEIDGLQTVALRVSIKTHMGALQQILHQLELDRPVMTVDQLNIQASGGRRLLASANDTPQLVDVQFELTAYMERKS